jgi:hypothetical protein
VKFPKAKRARRPSGVSGKPGLNEYWW